MTYEWRLTHALVQAQFSVVHCGGLLPLTVPIWKALCRL